MQHILRSISALTIATLTLVACDDNTANMGIFPSNDGITNSTALYQVISRSVKMDSVEANSAISYLGAITDPETGTDITAGSSLFLPRSAHPIGTGPHRP